MFIWTSWRSAARTVRLVYGIVIVLQSFSRTISRRPRRNWRRKRAIITIKISRWGWLGWERGYIPGREGKGRRREEEEERGRGEGWEKASREGKRRKEIHKENVLWSVKCLQTEGCWYEWRDFRSSDRKTWTETRELILDLVTGSELPKHWWPELCQFIYRNLNSITTVDVAVCSLGVSSVAGPASP